MLDALKANASARSDEGLACRHQSVLPTEPLHAGRRMWSRDRAKTAFERHRQRIQFVSALTTSGFDSLLTFRRSASGGMEVCVEWDHTFHVPTNTEKEGDGRDVAMAFASQLDGRLAPDRFDRNCTYEHPMNWALVGDLQQPDPLFLR